MAVLIVATKDLQENDLLVGAMGEASFPFGVKVLFVTPGVMNEEGIYSINTVEFATFHAAEGKAWTVQRRPKE